MTVTPPRESPRLTDDTMRVRRPDLAHLFAARAARCRALAPGHAVADYLGLLGALADAQDAACREMLIAPGHLSLLRPFPLAAEQWPRADAWRHALDRIVGDLAAISVPQETGDALARLRGMPAPAREQAAAAVLGSPRAGPAESAVSVFVAAALQVYWSTLAARVPPGSAPPDSGGRCPLCGSAPVAGTILGDRPLRYLTCSLCATAWRMTRLVCSHCGSTADVSYFAVEGAAPGIKAEACARCRRYLKLFYLEQVPAAEPFADDVASLALDLLMADEGFARVGASPFLVVTGRDPASPASGKENSAIDASTAGP